jgi:hypothetical protein
VTLFPLRIIQGLNEQSALNAVLTEAPKGLWTEGTGAASLVSILCAQVWRGVILNGEQGHAAESIKITALVIDEVLGTQLVLNKC